MKNILRNESGLYIVIFKLEDGQSVVKINYSDDIAKRFEGEQLTPIFTAYSDKNEGLRHFVDTINKLMKHYEVMPGIYDIDMLRMFDSMIYRKYDIHIGEEHYA